jgi:poly-gamma-glutamate capsule biosynthesis protein CapA/YwtB (metallophosphatase superfamily)
MSDTKKAIIVNITGDFCPGRMLRLSEQSSKVIKGSLIDVFNKGDINITNLEGPLTDCKDTIRKSGPHIKSSPLNITLLKDLDIDLVTLANNHIMDFVKTGLKVTMQTLSKESIAFVGAGSNLEEAAKTAILEIKGKKVAILNFAAHEFSIATSEQPGANPIDIIENYNQIRSAKNVSDYQIIIVHLGIEHYSYPTPFMQKLFRFYASLGVSAVIGHHSHCINGYEVFNGIPIFYGLGNFVFAGKSYPATWQEGLLLQLIFTPGAEATFIPYSFIQKIRNNELFLDIVSDKAPEILTQQRVASKWKEHLRKKHKRRNVLNHLQKRGFLIRALNKLFPALITAGIDASYLNMLRYENSYEYLIDVLQDVVEDI